MSAPSTTVRRDDEHHRYEIWEGDVRAGFSAFLDTDADGVAQRIFYHTVVEEAFGGRGYAGVLTREALADTVASGRRIVAVCPYVARWLTEHHDVDEHVDAVTPSHLRLLR